MCNIRIDDSTHLFQHWPDSSNRLQIGQLGPYVSPGLLNCYDHLFNSIYSRAKTADSKLTLNDLKMLFGLDTNQAKFGGF